MVESFQCTQTQTNRYVSSVHNTNCPELGHFLLASQHHKYDSLGVCCVRTLRLVYPLPLDVTHRGAFQY